MVPFKSAVASANLAIGHLKVAFFQKVRFVFQISKIKIFQKTILSLKFKFPTNYSILLLTGNLNFKFRMRYFRNNYVPIHATFFKIYSAIILNKLLVDEIEFDVQDAIFLRVWYDIQPLSKLLVAKSPHLRYLQPYFEVYKLQFWKKRFTTAPFKLSF